MPSESTGRRRPGGSTTGNWALTVADLKGPGGRFGGSDWEKDAAAAVRVLTRVAVCCGGALHVEVADLLPIRTREAVAVAFEAPFPSACATASTSQEATMQSATPP
jgi:hypothetical protein